MSYLKHHNILSLIDSHAFSPTSSDSQISSIWYKIIKSYLPDRTIYKLHPTPCPEGLSGFKVNLQHGSRTEEPFFVLYGLDSGLLFSPPAWEDGKNQAAAFLDATHDVDTTTYVYAAIAIGSFVQFFSFDDADRQLVPMTGSPKRRLHIVNDARAIQECISIVMGSTSGRNALIALEDSE